MSYELNRYKIDSENFSKGLFYLLVLSLFFPLLPKLNIALIAVNFGLVVVKIIIQRIDVRIFNKGYPFYLFIVIYLLYSTLSLIWAESYDYGISKLYFVLMHVMVFFVSYFWFVYDEGIRKHYLKLTVFVLVVYTLVCLWELVSANHLPLSKHYGSIIAIPTGFYFNQNNHAMVVAFIFPIICYFYAVTKPVLIRLALLLIMLTSVVIITIQGARLAMIVLIPLVIFVILRFSKLKLLVLVMLLFFSLSIYTASRYKKVIQLYNKYLTYQIESIGTEASTYKIGSTQVRINMAKRAVTYFIDSGFVGVGIGNYDYQTKKGFFGDVDWIENAHSYFFELLADLGIVVILSFISFYLLIIFGLWKAVSRTQGSRKVLSAFNLVSILLFIFISNLPSSMFNIVVMWVHLGYLAGFTASNA